MMLVAYFCLCFSVVTVLAVTWRLLQRVKRLEYIVEHAHQPQAPDDVTSGWVL